MRGQQSRTARSTDDPVELILDALLGFGRGRRSHKGN